MYDTLKPYTIFGLAIIPQLGRSGVLSSGLDILITLNKRLDTAAEAMAQRMIKRSSPRVLRAVSPFNKGSIELEAMSEEL